MSTQTNASTHWITDAARILHLDFSNTPLKIKSARNLCMAALLGFFAFFMAYHGYLLHAFVAIGQHSAPSIVMVEKTRFLLADAHSELAMAAHLGEPARATAITKAKNMMDQARVAQAEVAASLDFDDEKLPLAELAKAVGHYDQTFGYAIATNFSPEAMSQTHSANIEVLKKASVLEQINYAHLSKAYEQHGANAIISGIPTLILGLAAMGLLLWAQIELFNLSNRVFNKGYLIASLSATLFCILAGFSMLAAESALKIAKKDAFESVHALWLAKAVAHQAKTLRSALLSASGSASSVDAVNAGWITQARLISDLDAQGLRKAAASGRPFGGLLGQAMANITFEGERDALMSVTKHWADYIELPAASLAIAKTTKIHANSVDGLAILGKNGSFDLAISSIEKAIDINQKAFDQEIDIAISRLSWLPWLAIAMAAIGAIAIYFGAKTRLDEYHF